MSFRISISPKDRTAGRFVSRVRRSIQKALAEEAQKRGITQSDLARAIGVNRSVISREIRGHKDLSLSRVAELAWALGRRPVFTMEEPSVKQGSNVQIQASTSSHPSIANVHGKSATTSDLSKFTVLSSGGY